MPKFGDTSSKNLATCDPRLQNLMIEVVKDFDCAVIWGHRAKQEQDACYTAGTSNCRWPDSEHNCTVSRAVDVCPYPIDWEDRERFCLLAGWVLRTAKEFGVRIVWGGDWNGNFILSDETNISDLAHYQLGSRL